MSATHLPQAHQASGGKLRDPDFSSRVFWLSLAIVLLWPLGVATLDYLPYAFFNLVNPVLAGILAYTGFKILKLEVGGAIASRRVD